MTAENSKRRIERRHHKVDALPMPIRDELCRRFQGGETYESIAAWLEKEGHPIGKSSIHRWGTPFARRLERLQALRSQAQTLVAAVAGKPATELNEVAEQAATQELLEYLLELSEAKNGTPEQAEARTPGGSAASGGGAKSEDAPDVVAKSLILARVGTALSKLGTSASGRERVKLEFERRIAPAKQAAAETAKAALQKAGAPPESVVDVVDKILGITG